LCLISTLRPPYPWISRSLFFSLIPLTTEPRQLVLCSFCFDDDPTGHSFLGSRQTPAFFPPCFSSRSPEWCPSLSNPQCPPTKGFPRPPHLRASFFPLAFLSVVVLLRIGFPPPSSQPQPLRAAPVYSLDGRSLVLSKRRVRLERIVPSGTFDLCPGLLVLDDLLLFCIVVGQREGKFCFLCPPFFASGFQGSRDALDPCNRRLNIFSPPILGPIFFLPSVFFLSSLRVPMLLNLFFSNSAIAYPLQKQQAFSCASRKPPGFSSQRPQNKGIRLITCFFLQAPYQLQMPYTLLTFT